MQLSFFLFYMLPLFGEYMGATTSSKLGSNSLVYRKKIDRSVQFGALGYIITLYSPQTYVKSWGSVNFGGSGPPDPQWLRPWVNKDVYLVCQVRSVGFIRQWLNTYGRRAFSVAGPTVWNSLPNFIRDPTISLDCFRRLLKTYLFARY